MKLIEVPHLSVSICRENPGITYVFGDNWQRWGRGGQAIIRGEPNAYGVITKMSPREFLSDKWYEKIRYRYAADLHSLLALPVGAWPADGIGTGRAQLEIRAPLVWVALGDLYERLRSASE